MLEQISETLVDLWLFDMWVFSQWWLYAPLCIPALAYLCFFFCKWAVITTPVWLPVRMIIASRRREE